jgi:Fe2+ transport system protein FeoA
VQIGYRFIPEIKTLPVDGAVPGGPLTGRPRKITMVTLDLEETLSVSVNGTELVIRTVQQNQASGVNAVSGKEEFRVLGYDRDPRVTISQSAPLPIQVNGLVTEVAF